jgi:TonB-linked SusC/RagA family outer membrane protein
MKIFMLRNLLLCLLLLTASGRCIAQTLLERKVSIVAVDKPVSEIIRIMGEQTGLDFYYSPDGIHADKKMSLSVQDKTLRELLSVNFAAMHIRYQVLEDKILLMPAPAEQGSTVRLSEGVITDQRKMPIAGASVILKGTRFGTTTDADGRFSLSLRKEGPAFLLISCIGYRDYEVPFTGPALQIILRPDLPGTYDTMVVIGYGSTQRRDLTTSMGSITADQLTERPTAINILEGMQGKVAGVSVLNNSGRPGGSPSVIIRGTGSINASSNPLYVVDGIVGVDPNLLDPHIVQSMDVLKDAAATAIYGARGANGVVIITTRCARKGINEISFVHTLSAGALQHRLKLMDSEDALEMFKRTYANSNALPPNLDPASVFARKEELFTPDGRPRYHTDWQKEATRIALSSNSALSFSSGKDNLAGHFTVSYKDQQGILLNSDTRQLNLFANITSNTRSWLHVQSTINLGGQQGSNVDLNLFGLNAIREIYEFLPFLPVKYADGAWSRKGDYPNAENSENPVKLLNDVEDRTGAIYGNASIIGVIHLSPRLDLTTSWGGQLNASYHNYYSAKDVLGYSLVQNGVAQKSNGTIGSWTNEDYLTYKYLTGKHSLNLVAGASWYYTVNTFTSTGAENFFDNYFSYNNLQAGTVYEQPYSSRSDYRFNSYYLRVNYQYGDHLFLGSSLRVDGSSRFGADNKYGSFPSISGAWRFSNNLKLRASFGAVGNAEIQNYSSLNQLATTQVIFSGQPQTGVVLAPNAGNARLKWEKQVQVDLGFDAAFFNNRLQVTGDYYNKITSDMLYQKQLPASTGFTTVWDNIGSVRNRGLELSVASRNIVTASFSWVTTANYSMNRSKILDLNGDILTTWAGRLEKNRSMDEFYGYVRTKTWGTDEAAQAAAYGNKPGDVHWLDRNKDGVLDASDQTYLGHKMPQYQLNIANTFTFKSFSFYFDWQLLSGNKIINYTRYITAGETPQTNSYQYTLNAWTPERQNTVQGALRLGNQPNQNNTDNYNIEDAGFWRLRTVSLSYTLPAKVLQRLSFSRAVVSVTAENYLLFTHYTGYDPEVTPFDGTLNQGVDVFQYPKPKTLAFNLNLTF